MNAPDATKLVGLKKQWLLKGLGFANCLPTTIVIFFVYILPKLITKQIRWLRFRDYADVGVEVLTYCLPFEVIPGSKLEDNSYWRGMSMGAFILICDVEKGRDRGWLARTIRHEQMHTLQQYWMGSALMVVLLILCLTGVISWWWLIPAILSAQFIIYILCSIFIWVILKKRHAYFDNPFERQARWFAGQDVEIPKERWSDPKDRWIWW
jgi:hypothetical protein